MQHEEGVFKFDISITNTLTMAIIHTQDELLEEPACFILWEASSGHNKVEHIAMWNVLHDNGEVGTSGEDLFELDNVGVEEVLMVHDFAMSVLDIFIVTVGKKRGKETEEIEVG